MKLLNGWMIAGWMILAGVAAAQKIAVVDMKAIADRSQRIKADLDKSQGQVRELQDKLQSKLSEIQRAHDELNRQRTAMTESDVSAREEKIEAMRSDYNDTQEALNKKINQIQKQVLRPQAEKIQQIIAEVARDKGYDLVMDAEAVIYHSDAVDITPQVVQIFDRQPGASGAAEPALPPGASGGNKTQKDTGAPKATAKPEAKPKPRAR